MQYSPNRQALPDWESLDKIRFRLGRSEAKIIPFDGSDGLHWPDQTLLDEVCCGGVLEALGESWGGHLFDGFNVLTIVGSGNGAGSSSSRRGRREGGIFGCAHGVKLPEPSSGAAAVLKGDGTKGS